jgi:hypothetical protein
VRRWKFFVPVRLAVSGCGFLTRDVTEWDMVNRSRSDSRILVTDVEITCRGKEVLTDVMLFLDDGTLAMQRVCRPEWKPGETRSVRFVTKARPSAGGHGSATKAGHPFTLVEAGNVSRAASDP